jgi:hypothetical protein
MKALRVSIILTLALATLALFPAAAQAYGPPDKPSAVSPNNGALDVKVNPTLTGSAYSGYETHKQTQWEVDDNYTFDSPDWTRTSPAAEIQTVVNTANGTFANSLSGRTALDENERYYWRFRYSNAPANWSAWSDYRFFITVTTAWYLAEGSTAGGMETWVLVQNPGDTDAVVDIDFQTGEGPVAGPQGDVIPPNSRRSYSVGSYVTTYDVSTKVTATSGTVICERAMYGPGRAWGHDSIGVTTPRIDWYLAEGATAGGMETWVLVQNPNTSAVTVDLTLQTEGGPLTPAGLQNVEIPAASRHSFNLGLYVETYNVSTKVGSSGAVICERAMYGNGRQWGHDSIGAPDYTFMWLFAEGCTGEGFETWVLVQNPMSYQQEVALFFSDEAGPIAAYPRFNIPANSRVSVNVGDYVQSYNVAVTVTTWNEAGGTVDTDGKIICERAMYDSARTWGTDSIGSASIAAPAWSLPEGSTAGGMETWVLVLNPSSEAAVVSLVFMTDTGIVIPPDLQGVTLPPFSRRSFNVGAYVQSFDVSTLVDAADPVVCERSMYGPGRTWAHDSIGYILGLGGVTSASAGFSSAGLGGEGPSQVDAAAWLEGFRAAAR